MACRNTPRKLAKNTRPKLAASQSTKHRSADIFARLAQLVGCLAGALPLRRSRTTSAPRRPPLAYLDTNKTHRYKRGPMLRWARVALALVVIFTVAYILITPDPTDDVDGVLQPNHPALAHKIPAISLWESWTPVIVLFHSVPPLALPGNCFLPNCSISSPFVAVSFSLFVQTADPN